MQMSNIQVLVFTQSLVLKVKNPNLELTRNAVSFRNAYKKLRGLNRNATALVVLRDFKSVCEENHLMDTFNRATERYPEILASI